MIRKPGCLGRYSGFFIWLAQLQGGASKGGDITRQVECEEVTVHLSNAHGWLKDDDLFFDDTDRIVQDRSISEIGQKAVFSKGLERQQGCFVNDLWKEFLPTILEIVNLNFSRRIQMKKKYTQILNFSTLLVCIVFFMGAVVTAPAPSWGLQPDEVVHSSDKGVKPILGHRFAGTFFVSEGTSIWRIITLTADGNWFSIASNQTSIGLNPDMGYTDQQGVWKRTGNREITAQVLNFGFSPANDSHVGNSVAHYEVTFSRDFNSLTGQYDGRVYPEDQNPLDPENPDDYIHFEGTIEGTRVRVDQP